MYPETIAAIRPRAAPAADMADERNGLVGQDGVAPR